MNKAIFFWLLFQTFKKSIFSALLFLKVLSLLNSIWQTLNQDRLYVSSRFIKMSNQEAHIVILNVILFNFPLL